jgi:hypothetical protein
MATVIADTSMCLDRFIAHRQDDVGKIPSHDLYLLQTREY